MTESWFLVDTVGDSPSVLRIGARSKQWRPLSNEFRGSVRTTVLRLLETVLNNLKQSQVLVDLAGPRLAVAFPVLGVTRHVHGVLMWIGDPTYSLPREPETEAWEWDLSDRIVPSAVVKTKTPFSPGETLTDWLSRFSRPADILRVAQQIRTAQTGARHSGEYLDQHQRVHKYTMRCVDTFEGTRVVGVSVILPEILPLTDADVVSRYVLDQTVKAAKHAPAFLDADSHRVVAWLSPQRPNLPEAVLHGFDPLPILPGETTPVATTRDILLAHIPVQPNPRQLA
ncbi:MULTISPECIES: GAF domain-containing protein [unclassified Corynebacterium]|uniref:GAF domain-containing protein n=1 Tax=unclassified Corynebacterium TaxID=2624378 RepID=UPI0029CA5AD3|nr:MULTISPECIES: GAF domain-containing protein [unclassified Corynebacterium]WPF66038.1 DUF5593 domain-containing protein [Corynebacterium sp. 22KM0430]WPF68531.1 DUF5593 domain-containing protein [Corynebacterium sp. 21KM1197]